VCVVSDNELLVMFVKPDGKDNCHTVRKYLLIDEIH
jgi:hypothetical protein